MKKTTIFLLFLIGWLLNPIGGYAQEFQSENLFYIMNTPNGIENFRQNAEQISIIVPATYHIDEYGVITGSVNPKIMKIARAHNVQVMPIFSSFDQEGIHRLLNNEKAMDRAIQQMIYLSQKNHYYGWQFDLEHISFLDADAYTAFYRKAAKRLHENELKISMAVIRSYSPSPGPLTGNDAYTRHAFKEWAGAYQLKKLAKIGDFLSFMTYPQNNSVTPPGPVAGIPAIKNSVEYLKDLDIPMGKISLAIPVNSYYWHPTATKSKGAHSTASNISYEQVQHLMKRYDAKPHWLDKQGVSYAYWAMPNGVFHWLFIENARSFKEELQLVPQYGFRGISVWVLGNEDPNIWEVLKNETKSLKY